MVTFVLREIRFVGKRRNREASIFKDQTSERLGQYEQPKKNMPKFPFKLINSEKISELHLWGQRKLSDSKECLN